MDNALREALRIGREIENLLTLYPPANLTKSRKNEIKELLNIVSRMNERLAHIERMHRRDMEKGR